MNITFTESDLLDILHTSTCPIAFCDQCKNRMTNFCFATCLYHCLDMISEERRVELDELYKDAGGFEKAIENFEKKMNWDTVMLRDQLKHSLKNRKQFKNDFEVHLNRWKCIVE